MKISKLFHWLYALLMLLPFAFFVPSVLYYAFNDNATMQSVEVPKTETIAVDFNQYMKLPSSDIFTIYSSGATADFNGTEMVLNNATGRNGAYLKALERIDLNLNHKYLLDFDYFMIEQIDWEILFCTDVQRSYVSLPSVSSYTSKSSIITISDTALLLLDIFPHTRDEVGTLYINNICVFDLTQMFGSGNEPTINDFKQMFPNSYYPYTESELMQITYDTGETEQLIENTSIINYAWESIWDLPLFSWTKVTFVSVPFAYLTGLFGIGANSTLNYVFGYFATISICWLVFDVIMYVPMLVHRWIDKARIE